MKAVTERVVCVVLCASTLAGTAHGASGSPADATSASQHSRQVYYDGKLVQMTVVPGREDFKIGPWRISAQVQRDRPKDGHPNLYVAAPGTQYATSGAEQYSHNEVVSVVSQKPDPREWDVYFAIVLDPGLHEDFRSEQQLIIATQDDFQPAADFNFDDIPGAVFLRENLGIDSLDGLELYRRSDGKLPRLIIVPSKVTLKASAIDPDGPAQQKLGGTLPTAARSSVLPH